jgi:predicted transcriptional regulator
MKYRDQVDIMNQILWILTKSDTNKTRIKYEAFLTTRQIRHYLPLLIEREFIHFDQGSNCYSVSEKGRRFLDFQEVLNPALDRLASAILSLENFKVQSK